MHVPHCGQSKLTESSSAGINPRPGRWSEQLSTWRPEPAKADTRYRSARWRSWQRGRFVGPGTSPPSACNRRPGKRRCRRTPRSSAPSCEPPRGPKRPWGGFLLGWCSRFPLAATPSQQHDLYSLQDNYKIEGEAHVLDVIQIVLELLLGILERTGVLVADLRPAG